MDFDTETVTISNISEGDKIILNNRPRQVARVRSQSESITVLYLNSINESDSPTPYSFTPEDSIERIID